MDNRSNNSIEKIKMEKYNRLNSSRDIYSNTTQDIFSNSTATRHGKDRKVKKKAKLRPWVKALAVVMCAVIILGVAFYSYAHIILGKIQHTPLDEDNLGISTADYTGVKNIALLGLDTREDNKTGRADANVILTVDKVHKKLKLTTIARDSYVSIDGHKKDKLTHAYAFGKSQLSVKTLNENYGLEITDYVTLNFFELARIIDYLGGIEVDVDKKEMGDLNGNVIPNTDFGDLPCELIKTTGLQNLTGAQAVCYARIRKIDGDIQRGNRQKEVLVAMFANVKQMNPLKLPELAKMVLSECESSLTSNDIIGLGSWTLLNSPEIEQLSIPNDNVPSKGQTIRGTWYSVYDVSKAKTEIYDFINEINYYSPKEVEKRLQEQSEN